MCSHDHKPNTDFRMTPDEERSCWIALLWGAAARGEDPSVVWGPAHALTDFFVSVCIDLHDFSDTFMYLTRGDFTMAECHHLSVARRFEAAKWGLK